MSSVALTSDAETGAAPAPPDPSPATSGPAPAASANMHSSWIAPNCVLRLALSSRVLACVSSPRLKSKTSSDSNFRIVIEFSQRAAEALDAAQRSGTNWGQAWGQSCLRIWTSATSSLCRNVRSSFREDPLEASEEEATEMIMLLTKLRTPARCSSGSAPHRRLITSSRIWSAKNFDWAFVECSRTASTRDQASGWDCTALRTASAATRCLLCFWALRERGGVASLLLRSKKKKESLRD